LHGIQAAELNSNIDERDETDFIRNNLALIKFNPINAFRFTLQMDESLEVDKGSHQFKIAIQGKEDYLQLGSKVSHLLDSISLDKGEVSKYFQLNKQEVYQFSFNGSLYFLRSKSSIELIQSFFEAIWLSSQEMLILNGCGDVLPYQFVRVTFTPLNLFLFNENVPLGHVIGASSESLKTNEYEVIHKNEISDFLDMNANRLKEEMFDYSVLNPRETNSIMRMLIYDGIRFSEKTNQNEFTCAFSIEYTDEGLNLSRFSEYNLNIANPPFDHVRHILDQNYPSVLCDNFVNSRYDIHMALRTSEIGIIQRKNLMSMPILNELGFPSGRYSLRERYITVNDSVFHSTQLLDYKAYGWENGLLAAVVPGLGMKRVSNSLQKSILCFGMVALPAIFALTAEGVSQQYFKKYYNEVNDTPIGSSPNYSRANRWHKASLLSTSVSAVAWLFQFSWVIKLGIENDVEEKMIRLVLNKDKLVYVDEFKEYVQF
jgi:hypothetical protein